MSIHREDIRHAAILRPRFTKRRVGVPFCEHMRQFKSHAYVMTAKGYEQCIDCGKIKDKGANKHGIYNVRPN